MFSPLFFAQYLLVGNEDNNSCNDKCNNVYQGEEIRKIEQFDHGTPQHDHTDDAHTDFVSFCKSDE